MNKERLQEIVDIYGANRARWPQKERQAAENYALKDAQAAQILQEAEELEVCLASLKGQPTEEKLKVLTANILSAARQMPQKRDRLSWERFFASFQKRISGLWRQQWHHFVKNFGLGPWEGAALATSLLLGVALGLSDLPDVLVSNPYEVASARVMGGIFSEISDFQDILSQEEF